MSVATCSWCGRGMRQGQEVRVRHGTVCSKQCQLAWDAQKARDDEARRLKYDQEGGWLFKAPAVRRAEAVQIQAAVQAREAKKVERAAEKARRKAQKKRKKRSSGPRAPGSRGSAAATQTRASGTSSRRSAPTRGTDVATAAAGVAAVAGLAMLLSQASKGGSAEVAPSRAVPEPPPPGPPGTHRVITADLKHWDVPTLHAVGLYAVHAFRGQASAGSRRQRAFYSVTHTPTGFAFGPPQRTLRRARQLADHMHATVGSAGDRIRFGRKPGKGALGRMKQAADSWVAAHP